MSKFRPLESCPRCEAIWSPGSEEWDWQQCFACGWPEGDDEDFEDDDYIEDDIDSFYEDNNPNDSRNL